MAKAALRFLIVFLFIIMAVCKSFAQVDTSSSLKTDTLKPLKIAILAPIYLDSVFMDNMYIGSNALPNYMLPGLDFYNGAMMAVDSLQKENVPVEVYVFDTKKKFQTTDMLKVDLETENFSLIIAYVTSALEQQQLAALAFNHNIPFISGTYPNDAGVTGNPYYAIINSTVKTHVEAVYNYVQRSYVGSKVYFVTKAGGMEQKIKGYFDAMKLKNYALKYTPIQLSATFTSGSLLPLIDSTDENVIICGSLDAAFGAKVIKTINGSAAAKQTTIIGMPTWDDMDALYSEDSKNVAIVYTTPYNYNRKDKLVASIGKQYHARYNGRPSDMAFKGFEQVYHFTHLLVHYRDSLFAHLSDNTHKIASDYNFQPVRLSPTSYPPDYLENKKLYFIKMMGGSVKAIN